MLTKAEIQSIRSLGDKKGRQAEGVFVAEGVKLVTELAAGEGQSGEGGLLPLRVRRLFCTQKGMQEFGSDNVPVGRIELVSSKEMERISLLKTPSEMLALVEIPRYALSVRALSETLCLVLDGVQDPGNMGTILRLADWFGIRDVICSETTADCFNPKVVQATMGAIARVRVHYTALEPFLTQVVAAGSPLYGTFLNGTPIYDAQLSARGMIVMGSEGRGVSPGVETLITDRLYIPPFPAGVPTSESLNVATATAIVCFEFRRRV